MSSPTKDSASYNSPTASQARLVAEVRALKARVAELEAVVRLARDEMQAHDLGVAELNDALSRSAPPAP